MNSRTHVVGRSLAIVGALVAFLIASSGIAQAQDSESESESEEEASEELELEEALELAREYAPLLRELDAREDFAAAQKSRADRAWWPKIRAESLLAPVPDDADPTRFDENLDEITSFNLGPYFRQTVQVLMPIYTFGRISKAQELAELGVDVADLERSEAIQEHLLRTRQAYYGRQLAQAFGDLLEEGDDLIKDTLEQMEEDRAFGEADFETEDLRRLQIFNAELDTMLLDNARLRDLTESALLYLTDTEGAIEVPGLTPEQADVPLDDLATYQDLARRHRPDLQQLERGVQARRLQEDLARREFYPNLFIAGDFGFGWSTQDVALQPICRRTGPDSECVQSDTLFAHPYSNPFDTLTFGIALGLQWNFDFGQLQGRLHESQARVQEVESQRERAIGALDLEIERTWRDAYDARERIEIAERRYDAARRWRNQYGLQSDLVSGDTDMKDLIDPLRAYYEARVAHLEAVHAYLAARAELANAVGLESLSDDDE